ncbi:MAG: hypothetical protein ACI82H_000954, partial [Alphaproteobacteria bacterium]
TRVFRKVIAIAIIDFAIDSVRSLKYLAKIGSKAGKKRAKKTCQAA